VQRWPDAETNLKKSLEYVHFCGFDPAIEANYRMGLHPEECRSLLTLAHLLWKRGEDGASLGRRCLDVLRMAPLIEPATRVRWLAKVEVNLDCDCRSAEAIEARVLKQIGNGWVSR
jgi:hypothetical protein